MNTTRERSAYPLKSAKQLWQNVSGDIKRTSLVLGGCACEPTVHQIPYWLQATDKDMKCRGFQFELGKWYEVEGELALCGNGLVFCDHWSGVWAYYSDPGSRVFKIEAEDVLDLAVEPGADHKRVCRRIRLVKRPRRLMAGNSGDGNSGNRNSGEGTLAAELWLPELWQPELWRPELSNRNSGDRNSGYRNSGYPELWQPELWRQELWLPELWLQELWRRELWRQELWPPELWLQELWQRELWLPELWLGTLATELWRQELWRQELWRPELWLQELNG